MIYCYFKTTQFIKLVPPLAFLCFQNALILVSHSMQTKKLAFFEKMKSEEKNQLLRSKSLFILKLKYVHIYINKYILFFIYLFILRIFFCTNYYYLYRFGTIQGNLFIPLCFQIWYFFLLMTKNIHLVFGCILDHFSKLTIYATIL